VLAIETVSVGSLNASIVHPREVLKPAILASAAGIIVAHNHPSGDPTPSADDVEITKRLARAADIMGIPLLDHVIVGSGGRFESLKARGIL
jgi:DNA repair protein RadC